MNVRIFWVCAYVYRLDLSLCSHPEEFWGNGVWNHVNSKGKIPSRLRGGSNPQRCIMQDRKPNTLPTELFQPPDLGSIPAFIVDIFFKLSHTSDLKFGPPGAGYPVRHLAVLGQHWDWLVKCQSPVTGWDSKFDEQPLYQCGSMYCLSRSVPNIHWHAAETFSKQPTATTSIFFFQYGFKRQKSTGSVNTDEVYSGGKYLVGPDFEFKTFKASAHFETLRDVTVFTSDKLEVNLKDSSSPEWNYRRNMFNLFLKPNTFNREANVCLLWWVVRQCLLWWAYCARNKNWFSYCLAEKISSFKTAQSASFEITNAV